MKKKIYIVIAGMILLILLPGIFSRQVSISTTNIIRANSGELFTYMVMPGRLKLWLSDFERAELIGSLMEDELANQFLVTYTLVGRRTNFLVEITEFDANSHVALYAEPPKLYVELVVDIREDGNSSVLDTHLSLAGTSLLRRSLLFYLKPVMKKSFERDLQGLSSLLEDS